MTEEQAVRTLHASESFISFSKHFIPDFATLMRYHRSRLVTCNANAFLVTGKICRHDVMKEPQWFTNHLA
jgi:hypothetical protein